MMNKYKKKNKKAVNELAYQILHAYYVDYAPESATNNDGSLNSDKAYFNGMIDGLTFALTLLDKKSVPMLPSALHNDAFELVFEPDNDGKLFTTPEVIDSEELQLR